MRRLSGNATAKRFRDLLQTTEQSDAFQLDRLKVEISEQIYQAMNQQGISNSDLARRLGKSRAYVTKLLRGTTNFTLESLVRISRALSNEVEINLVTRPPARRRARTSRPITTRLTPPRKASQAS